MDLFMPAERVLYDRAYYLSDEAERDYAFEVAEEHGIDVGEVLYSDELMKEVRDALDRDIDLYLDDEIANFDSMLRELKRGENPEHPAEISVVAMGSVGRWDGPSRGLVAANSLRDDLTERFGFFYDIDFSGLTFKTSLILSVKSLYFEGDVVDSALDWQADYLPCVCHRGGQGENDRWEYEPTDDYRPFTRPADIPESIFDKLCASQGTTIEKVVNDPVTKFERSFREDIFNSQQNSLVGLTVLATLPLDAFLDASLSMICRGDREKAGTFTVKPGTYEPIMGIYDPINGCGGTAGIELDTDFDIDPRDIKYTMMEPRGGKWESDRIDLYTPQDCFGFSEPFAGRIEYSEKKPKIAAKAKPDPADLGRRASVAAGATIRDGVDGGGIKL